MSGATFAIKKNTDGKNKFGLEADRCPPFFQRYGHLHIPTQLSEDFKTPIKISSNIILQVAEIMIAKWKSNPAYSKLCS